MAISLSLVVLKTKEVEQLRLFYEVLGIELVEEKHGTGPVHFSGKLGEAILEIYPLPSEAATADSTTRLGFVVEKLDDTLKRLRGIGIVVGEPRRSPWGRRAVVRDPDGSAVEVYEE